MLGERRARAGRTVAGLVVLLSLVGCAGRKSAPEVQFATAEAQYQQGLNLLGQRKLAAAAEMLGKIHQYSAEDRKKLEPRVRLALADATFYQASSFSLIDARALYLDFVTLYSDHALAPYAQFQAGVCSLEQVSHPSKDQTQTHRAIADLQEVPRRYPASPYAEAARRLIRKAEANLAEHEFLVGRFYMKRKAYAAAVDRFRDLLTRYPGFAGREKVYFYLGQTLLLADNAAEGRIYLDRLVADFPDGRYVTEARKALATSAGSIETDVARSP